MILRLRNHAIYKSQSNTSYAICQDIRVGLQEPERDQCKAKCKHYGYILPNINFRYKIPYVIANTTYEIRTE